VRADLTPLVLSIIYLVAGAGVMVGSGLVRSWREMLAAVGMAYVAGLVSVLLIGTWLLAIGLAVTVPATILISAVLGAGGLVLGARRRRSEWQGPAAVHAPACEPARRSERLLVALAVAALAVIAVLGYLSARRMLLTEWDAWSIWARKARLLLELGTPPAATFGDSHYAFMHPDYPLLVPLMESTWFRVAGFADTSGVHTQFWLLFVATLGAAGWVARRAGAQALACLALVGLVAVAPGLRTQLLSMYADVPMALLLGLGTLLLGRWLQAGDRKHLGLSALMFAGAANMKNEGLSGAAAVLLAGVVVAAVSGAPGLRSAAPARVRSGAARQRLSAAWPAIVAAGAALASVLPWRIWLAAHGISGDLPVGKGLDPAFLADRSGRVIPAIDGFVTALSDQATWLYLVPLGAGTVVVGLLTPGLRRISAFYSLAGVLVLASLVWGFWISPNEIHWQVQTAAGRVVVAVVMVAAVAALHLATGALGARLEARTERREAGRRSHRAAPWM
jgi:hypothetical protein